MRTTGIKCKVLDKYFLGDTWEYKVVNKNIAYAKNKKNKSDIKVNESVKLNIDVKNISFFKIKNLLLLYK